MTGGVSERWWQRDREASRARAVNRRGARHLPGGLALPHRALPAGAGLPVPGRTALAVHELSVYIIKSLYMTLFTVSIICAQCYMISHVTIYDVGVAGIHTQVKPIKVLL